MNRFQWDSSFSVDFNLQNGFSEKAETTKRYSIRGRSALNFL